MGFDENRFESEIDDFRCSICHDVIEDPIGCANEHVFCRLCIYQWLDGQSSCPVDRQQLDSDHLTQPSRFFRNFYSRLRIRCEFVGNGCASVCSIGELAQHENSCVYRFMSACRVGCGAIVDKNKCDTHKCVEFIDTISDKFIHNCNETKLLKDLREVFEKNMKKLDTIIGENVRSNIDLQPISPIRKPLANKPTIVSAQQQQLINSLKSKGIIKTAKVEEIMLSVDRQLFCPSNPYKDNAGSIGYGTTISAPHMHAHILELISDHLKPESRALDIGSGSGYLTFCMAQFLQTSGQVYGIDHVPQLIEKCRDILENNFAHLANKLQFVWMDGRNGYASKGPFDVINIGAAIPSVSQELKNQLKIGGRLLAPVGEPNQSQQLITIDRLQNGSFKEQTHLSVVFGSMTDLNTQLSK